MLFAFRDHPNILKLRKLPFENQGPPCHILLYNHSLQSVTLATSLEVNKLGQAFLKVPFCQFNRYDDKTSAEQYFHGHNEDQMWEVLDPDILLILKRQILAAYDALEQSKLKAL